MIGDDIGAQPKGGGNNLWDGPLMRNNILPRNKINKDKGNANRQPEQKFVCMHQDGRVLTKPD